MRRTLQSALLLGLSTLAAAVFKDEVGDIDFHYSLLGLPRQDATFFHRPRRDEKASLLYTISDLGVVGAVNPSNGDLVWRQRIADDADDVAAPGFLRAPEGEHWVAAAQGSKVQAWGAASGRNIWQTEFKGEVKDLEILEITEASRKDVLALFDEDGVTVLRRLHGALGTVIWEFREHSKDVPLQVSNNIANVYVVSLHGSGSSYNLKVTSLDTATGSRVDHWSVGTKGDIHGPSDVMFVGANSAAPIVAWANSGLAKLSVNILGSKSKQDFHLPPDAASVQIHAPHLAQSQPHFLVHIQTKPDGAGEKNNGDEQRRKHEDDLVDQRALGHGPDHGNLALGAHARDLLGVEGQVIAQHAGRLLRSHLGHDGHIVGHGHALAGRDLGHEGHVVKDRCNIVKQHQQTSTSHRVSPVNCWGALRPGRHHGARACPARVGEARRPAGPPA